ncbi:MAG: SEC-C metal-binding domain-containing protein, partial [Chloroflexi bacterium]|nr:SEC-C metal-binding domain-containing protein [Chloroflexota bacterium]
EGYNFDIRKHLLDYDDVVNKQREIIYSERNKILEGSDLKANICNMMKSEMANHVNVHLGNKDSEEWDIDGLLNDIKTIIPVTDDINKDSLAKLSRKELEQKLMENIDSAYTKREQEIGVDDMRKIERVVMLRTIDRHWIQYLTEMEHLREGIGLEAYGQRDPLMVYKKEAHAMFQNLQTAIQTDITHLIMNVNIVKQQASTPQRKLSTNKEDGHKEPAKSALKIGRNDLCPCGSGKKYKYCCGKS